jgi:hypothetical protein
MRASGVGDAAETLKAVADDRAGRFEAALGEAGEQFYQEPPNTPGNVGLALSGGGSRALTAGMGSFVH